MILRRLFLAVLIPFIALPALILPNMRNGASFSEVNADESRFQDKAELAKLHKRHGITVVVRILTYNFDSPSVHVSKGVLLYKDLNSIRSVYERQIIGSTGRF